MQGFPCDSAGKASPCNVGDLGLISGLGRSLEKGKTTHSSILAWRILWTAYSIGVAKSGTQLSNFHFHFISFFLSLFCSIAVISTILSFSLSHHSPFSTLLPVILLKISSSAFFIPVIVLFITVYSLAFPSLF